MRYADVSIANAIAYNVAIAFLSRSASGELPTRLHMRRQMKDGRRLPLPDIFVAGADLGLQTADGVVNMSMPSEVGHKLGASEKYNVCPTGFLAIRS